MKRLALSLITLVLFSIFALTWLLSEMSYRMGSGSSEDFWIQPYVRVSEHIKADFISSAPTSNFESRWQNQADFKVKIHDRNQFPLDVLLNSGWTEEDPLILESNGELSVHFLLQGREEILSVVWPFESGRQAFSYRVLLTIIFYVGIILVVLLWVYPLIMRLNLLGKTARAFGQGNLDVRLQKSGFRYIDQIEREFNAMADRIERLLEDNKLLSRAVSHDLKTPIARLRFGLDVLNEADDEEERKDYLARLDADLNEMEELVTTLLEYAKLDQNHLNIKATRLNLSALITDIVGSYQSQDIVLEFCDGDEPLNIIADKKYLQMLIKNVLNNAVNFAHSKVRVSVSRAGDSAKVVVEDDGPGFKNAEREELLKPFARGAQQGRKVGHGMGLAIVSRIAHWLEGKVVLDYSAELGGASVTLILPIA